MAWTRRLWAPARRYTITWRTGFLAGGIPTATMPAAMWVHCLCISAVLYFILYIIYIYYTIYIYTNTYIHTLIYIIQLSSRKKALLHSVARMPLMAARNAVLKYAPYSHYACIPMLTFMYNEVKRKYWLGNIKEFVVTVLLLLLYFFELYVQFFE